MGNAEKIEDPCGHYTGVGVGVGVAIGVALGAALDNTGAGIAIGIAIGACIGANIKKQKEIDITNLAEPSANVRLMCTDYSCRFPSREFAEAVKTYCDETGASLSQGTEVLKDYVAKQPPKP